MAGVAGSLVMREVKNMGICGDRTMVETKVNSGTGSKDSTVILLHHHYHQFLLLQPTP